MMGEVIHYMEGDKPSTISSDHIYHAYLMVLDDGCHRRRLRPVANLYVCIYIYINIQKFRGNFFFLNFCFSIFLFFWYTIIYHFDNKRLKKFGLQYIFFIELFTLVIDNYSNYLLVNYGGLNIFSKYN